MGLLSRLLRGRDGKWGRWSCEGLEWRDVNKLTDNLRCLDGDKNYKIGMETRNRSSAGNSQFEHCFFVPHYRGSVLHH